MEDHHHVERKQQAAAQIAEAVAERRDRVGFVAPDHFHDERIVKGIAAGEADGGQDIDHNRQLPRALGDHVEAARGEDAQEGKGKQELAPGAALVGNSSQKRG